MARRVVLEIVLIVGIAIALAWLLVGIVLLFDAGDPVAAIVDGAPRMLFGVMGIALGLWTLLVVMGAIVTRHRSARRAIVTHLITLIVSIGVNVLALTAIAFIDPSGWGLLLVGIALAAGAALLVAGTASVLLVVLVILRRTAPVEPEAEPALPPR